MLQMINVWQQKKSRRSGKIYYNNILTNESNNIFLMHIPHRGMKLRGGEHLFDYDNMTIELYNQQNPDYPMRALPPTNFYSLEEWMDRPLLETYKFI